MQLMEATDQKQWDELVTTSQYGHPLQLWAWGELKRKNGWTPLRLTDDSGTMGAQILFWKIPKSKRKLAYIPRGPIIDPNSPKRDAFLEALGHVAKQQGAIQLKVEPAWVLKTTPAPSTQHPESDPRLRKDDSVEKIQLSQNWKLASDHVLMAQTYTIDLNKSEDELLAAMRTKARQYARKAERDGVTINRVTDPAELELVWKIYTDTAERAGFGLHAKEYYQQLFELAGDANYLFLAKQNDQPIAFVWLIAAAGTAFELYGGMTQEGAHLRANYALKWAAIRAMKQAEFKIYDFNGRLNDGVSAFKAMFGADETDWIGSYNLPLLRPHYELWQTGWPIAKKLSKLRGSK